MKVELKRCQETDLGALLPLVEAYHALEQIESTAASRETALRRLIGHPEFGAAWLIHCNGEIGGHIILCRGYSVEFGGFDAFIDELYLSPSFRGRGVGRRVLDLIRPQARALEINALHLEVARDNDRARGLYSACGFEAREKYVLMSLRIDEKA